MKKSELQDTLTALGIPIKGDKVKLADLKKIIAGLAKNDLGGVDDLSPEATAKAEKFDLVTLPEAIEGTNCANCRFVDKTEEQPLCKHPNIMLPVTPRMCCALWDAEGVYRSWQAKNTKSELEPDHAGQKWLKDRGGY